MLCDAKYHIEKGGGPVWMTLLMPHPRRALLHPGEPSAAVSHLQTMQGSMIPVTIPGPDEQQLHPRWHPPAQNEENSNTRRGRSVEKMPRNRHGHLISKRGGWG